MKNFVFTVVFAALALGSLSACVKDDLSNIDIKVDGEFVELSYDFGHTPFHRIRRITGYLVGTLDRFNNGKRAEERDRVKHSMPV